MNCAAIFGAVLCGMTSQAVMTKPVALDHAMVVARGEYRSRYRYRRHYRRARPIIVERKELVPMQCPDTSPIPERRVQTVPILTPPPSAVVRDAFEELNVAFLLKLGQRRSAW